MNVTCVAARGLLLDQATRAHVVFVSSDYDVARDLAPFVKIFTPLKTYLDEQQFSAKSGQLVVVPVASASGVTYLMIGGLGKNTDGMRMVESYRRSLGAAVQQAKRLKLDRLAVQVPDIKGADVHYLARETAIVAHMAFYEFDVFKPKRNGVMPVGLILTVVTLDASVIDADLERGTIIGRAVNEARAWVDLPSQAKYPQDIAAFAQSLAKEEKLVCTVFDAEHIKKMGMGGITAVSSGSTHDCRLVVLEYKSARKDAPTVALVGKGITFDSGGLDLKTADGMESQKVDMSGAAAVIATMRAVARLKPDVNVVALAPLAQNMPSGSAYRPGDIVTFYNGKTAEVGNTDAEGRLILADALAYAVKNYKPMAIIDIATLTKVCEYAVGIFFSGIFSEHEDLVARVQQAAQNSGDYVWRLPLTDDYKRAIASEIADISNTSKKKYFAGASTAAAFLQHFVDDVPWVHIDAAGTAFGVMDVPYYRATTATGVGVRLFVQLLTQFE